MDNTYSLTECSFITPQPRSRQPGPVPYVTVGLCTGPVHRGEGVPRGLVPVSLMGGGAGGQAPFLSALLVCLDW